MKRRASTYLYIWQDSAIGIRLTGDTVAELRNFSLVEEGGTATIDPSFAPWASSLQRDRFYLLVDTVDESHVIEEIPKLAKRDQDNLIKKRISQRFRESEFVASRALAPQKLSRRRATDKAPGANAIVGRRVYLCGLIDEQVVKPWIDALLQCKIRIAGFSSPSLLAPKVRSQTGGGDNGLLLSIAKGGLRQTLIIDGVVQFSRLAVAHDTRPKAIQGEINRTIQYLTASRRLTREAVDESRFTIWIIESGLQHARELPASLTLNGGQSARVALIPHQTFAPLEIPQAPELAPWIWGIRQGSDRIQYATPRIRHYDNLGIWKQRLWSGSLAVTAIGLVMTLAGGLVAELVLPDTEASTQQHARSERRAAELTARLERYGVSAEEVNAITSSAQRLRARNIPTRDMLELIAAGMGSSDGLTLSRVQWLRLPLGSDAGAGAPMPSMATEAMPGTEGVAVAGSAESEPAVPIKLMISGEVGQTLSKSEANEQVSALLQRMLSYCDCSLERLVLPYDPAPGASLSESFVSQSKTALAFDVDLVVKAIRRSGAKG
ncbi:MAG: hypothetical protein R3E87_13295 [Burkholderiaceae bacterium]